MDSSLIDSCPHNLGSAPGYFFLSLVNALFAGKCDLGSKSLYPEDYGTKLQNHQTFDYIVVGAGSAGSVVANKLSENGKYTVLVLEAGGYPSATTDIPSMLFTVQGTEEDWQYNTEPSPLSCLGMTDGRCKWPRGKLLGGSSSINAMMYVRGNHRDYDNWASMGNTGWNWHNVLPHFEAIENLKSEKLSTSTQFGRNGYLTLTSSDSGEPIKDTIQKAGNQLGYLTLLEENPLNPQGYFVGLLNVDGGIRENAAKSFIGKVKDRKNLYLALHAFVRRIIIDQNSKEAKGVEVKIGTNDLELYANKEIIISAGSINSPQILMLSGIGPEEHLKNVNINPIVDLPVGKNLQDHLVLGSPLVKLLDNAVKPSDQRKTLEDIFEYFTFKTGEMAGISITNLLGFFNTKNDSIYPNIEFDHILYKSGDTYLLPEVIRCAGYNEDISKSMMELVHGSSVLQFIPILLNPKSRGEILLKSNNPDDKPLIYSGYFTDKQQEDIETMLEAIRFTEALISTDAFKKHEPEILNVNVPTCHHLEFQSDDYWKCILRHMGSTIYHPVGTCSMGPRNDGTSVVSPRLRVHGVKRLRVVDASIMPKITSGNTNAPTMMIGHKAGAMILEDTERRYDEL